MSSEQPDFYETFNPVQHGAIYGVVVEALKCINNGNIKQADAMLWELATELRIDHSIYQLIEAKSEKGDSYVNQ